MENVVQKDLYYQRKRKKYKINLLVKSMIFLIISLMLIFTYIKLNQDSYIKYSEKAEIDYKVNLKENEFYKENYVGQNTNVVASLIKNIETQFKYNLNLQEEQEYTYTYTILAEIEVGEKNKTNPIYELKEELIKKDIQDNNAKNLEIVENLIIDYNEYNNKISKFISFYELDNITSKLTLNMYLNITNKYNEERINKEQKVMSLEIPLTTKTVEISMASRVIENEGEILTKKSEYQGIEYILVIGLIALFISFVIFIKLIKNIIETRSAEKMYDQEIKRILFDYRSYIQKINNELDTSNYKVLEINSFDEILQTSAKIQAPILMYTENKERTKFMIRDKEILFVYILGVKEIRNVLIEKSKKGEETSEKMESQK